MSQETGKWIIFIGLLLVGVGILFYLFGPYLKWIGRLPGDFRIERENFKFYFPLTTLILLSLVVNLLLRAWKYWKA
ncbi:MAG: DUF2905 domain-containing protein [Saprospiraceae bacterium]|nr:DUF2905 domain-containing protein [Saprospiraceae bacterium]MBK7809886.1 DUF2905 domain-containing protein [Saprospiraceae bacterium]MBK9629493.1 DUF2905 domain-containing protein [Saprospiraceae bacterium]